MKFKFILKRFPDHQARIAKVERRETLPRSIQKWIGQCQLIQKKLYQVVKKDDYKLKTTTKQIILQSSSRLSLRPSTKILESTKSQPCYMNLELICPLSTLGLQDEIVLTLIFNQHHTNEMHNLYCICMMVYIHIT